MKSTQYEYLLCCTGEDGNGHWSVFSFNVQCDRQIRTIADLLNVQPAVQKRAETSMGVQFHDFSILMFHELEPMKEETENDGHTEEDTAE